MCSSICAVVWKLISVYENTILVANLSIRVLDVCALFINSCVLLCSSASFLFAFTFL